MKIGLVGTHSTGKTTLAKFFSEKYKIPYERGDTARDIGRNIISSKRLDQFSNEEQWNLQKKFLDCCNDIQNKEGPFITDCCSVTCDSYSKILIGKNLSSFDGYKNFLGKSYEGARHLTHILYLPAELNLVYDGFRPESEKLRLDIDKKLLKTLSKFQFYILNGTLERRAEQIAVIAGLQKKSMWDNYISFEGLPGSGKTTQIKILSNELETRGRKFYVCKRFGNESLEKKLHELYKNPIKNREELLELHAESFSEQFVKNEVKTRLEDNVLVISDRQKFTAIAMQLALGNSVANCYYTLKDVPSPGKVLYLNISPHLSIQRRKYEKHGNLLKTNLEYQTNIKKFYDWLSEHHYEFQIINANRSIENISRQILKSLDLDYNLESLAEDSILLEERYLSQGTKPWGLKETAIDLQYQIGSLSKLILQAEGFVHSHGLSKEDINNFISLDIADIITLSLSIAKKMNINPDESFKNHLKLEIEKIKNRVSNI